MTRPKILLITNTVSPYRVPVFNKLAEKTDIVFVFLCGMLGNLKLKVPWASIKFRYIILKSREAYRNLDRDLNVYLSIGFLKTLREENPAVLVSLGYSYIETFLALFYAKLKGKKFVLWCGSTLKSSRSGNPAVKAVKKLLIKNCDAFLTYGRDATDYLLHYGADPRKIVTGCNTIDVDAFAARAGAISETELRQFRAGNNLSEFNIIACSQLIARKNLRTLINAFAKLNRTDWGLIIAGAGPLLPELEKQIADNSIKNVYFKGHVDYPEIVFYYRCSDIFVLPSLNELWGLAVNEAMACGLPVICSNKAGATRDLVQKGVNGYPFNPEDEADLAEKLRLLAENPARRKEMGQKSLEIIKQHTAADYAASLLQAVNIASGKQHARIQ